MPSHAYSCLDNYMHGYKILAMIETTPTSSATTAADSIGLQLSLVRTELVRTMEEALANQGFDLRFSQFQTLIRLYSLGSMGAGELARSLSYDAGAMTRLLDQLAARHYLRRLPDPIDRRALLIELTPEGEQIGAQLRLCADQVMSNAQSALDASEQKNLRDYLERMLVTLRTMDQATVGAK